MARFIRRKALTIDELESHMSVTDWENLAIAAGRQALAVNDNPDVADEYTALFFRCKYRAEALRAGRVMP